MSYQRYVFLAAFGLVLVGLSLPSSTFSNTSDRKNGQQTASSGAFSHARVVRLSFMEGGVTVRRPGSTEWTSASLNSPIQEGFSVATDKKSFAEVQFENGSTARLGELTVMDFTELSLSAQGGHINRLTLDDGYATFHFSPERRDEYLLSASGVDVTPQGKTEFRADLSQDRLRVEVFGGHVQVADSNQTETIGKDHALVRSFDPTSTFQIIDKFEKDEWDKWADAREQQSTLAYNDEAVNPGTPVYGWDDLDVYGEWSYLPGYGNAWAPYEPLGWSPYSSGMWDWYAGMGYTWISGEPWGWLPFHYGFWNFNPGMGWFWMPGSFATWNPALVNWYSGPGWVGWAPVGPTGVGGRAPCTLAVAGCLTAVPPTVLSNREPIGPGNPHILHPGSTDAINAIERPDVPPIRSNPPSAEPFARVAHGSGETSVPRSTLSASGFAHGREGAPSSLVMGRQVTPEAFMGRHSVFKSELGAREPVRVRLGGTIGGKFPAPGGSGLGGRSTIGGRDSHGLSGIAGGPQILTRSSNGTVSRSGDAFGSRNGGASPNASATSSISSSGAAGGAHGGGSPSSGSSGAGGGHH